MLSLMLGDARPLTFATCWWWNAVRRWRAITVAMDHSWQHQPL